MTSTLTLASNFCCSATITECLNILWQLSQRKRASLNTSPKQLQPITCTFSFWAILTVASRPNSLPYATGPMSCLSVTLVYCSQTGWMTQDNTWYGGRPRPRQQCVIWGPSSPKEKGRAASSPYFSAHVYCGQTVAHLSNC